jgi:hypothetical protein
MLIIKTNQPNSLVVTVSQNSELTNPEYLFSFTHIFSKQNVSFIPVDVSLHKSRYDEFYFVEGTGVGEIHFPYEGLYLYSISEQLMGSGNLNPALAFNVVENGEAQLIVQSAITVNSQFDTYISPNEDNSNIIFAPDEPNPTPNITPSPTSTPNQPTPSPTPSITPTITPTTTVTPSLTPTLTPTPSTTPPVANPSQLGASWWVDFTDSNNVILDNSFNPPLVNAGRDLITNNFIFSADTSRGPSYSGTGYDNTSGALLGGGDGISNALGTFSGTSAYTVFMNVNLVGQNYGQPLTSDDQQNYLGQQQGYRWLSVDNGFPSDSVRCYSFATNGQSTSPEVRDEILNSGWTFVAVRVYRSGSDFITELWVNGNNVDDTTMTGLTPITATNPIFILGRSSQSFHTAEMYFFDRALTDADMTKSFNYLNGKYPAQ